MGKDMPPVDSEWSGNVNDATRRPGGCGKSVTTAATLVIAAVALAIFRRYEEAVRESS